MVKSAGNRSSQCECQYCGRPFSLKSNCVRHERIHTNDKPHKCRICLTRFILKKNMIDHMRVHTGEKPFHCNTCSEKFNRRSSLVRHERIHSGERPFTCFHCDKSFAWKFYLLRHIVNAHMKPPKKIKSRNKSKAKSFEHADLVKLMDEYKLPLHELKNMIEVEDSDCNGDKMFQRGSKTPRFHDKEKQLHLQRTNGDNDDNVQRSCIPENIQKPKISIILTRKNTSNFKKKPSEETCNFEVNRKEFEQFFTKQLVVRVPRYNPDSNQF